MDDVGESAFHSLYKYFDEMSTTSASPRAEEAVEVTAIVEEKPSIRTQIFQLLYLDSQQTQCNVVLEYLLKS